MSAKEIVLESVRQMSDGLTMDEIVEELAILAGIRRGEQAAEEGRVISHDEMKKRVASWNTN
jgi:predicted transcriptional regulator